MYKNTTISALLGICISASAMCFLPAPVMAAGVSPALVTVSSILKGSTQAKQVTVSRDQGTTGDVRLKVASSGANASLVQAPAEFVIPGGANSAVLPLTIDASRANAGSYRVPVCITEQAVAAKTKGATNAVIKSVCLAVSITVSETPTTNYDIFDAKVSGAVAPSPMALSFSVSNTGNIAWKPTRVVFTLQHIYPWVDSHTYTVELSGDSIPSTNPGAIKTITASTASMLPSNEINAFKGTATFYDNGKAVRTVPVQTFRF